jgi:hypothetical protein
MLDILDAPLAQSHNSDLRCPQFLQTLYEDETPARESLLDRLINTSH